MTSAAKDLVQGVVKDIANSQPLAELGGLTQDDLELPRWQLIQAKSKLSEQGHQPGHLYNSVTNTSAASIEFIPLALPTKYSDILKKEFGKMVFEARVFDQTDPRLTGLDYFGNRKEDRKANAVRAYVYSGVSGMMPCMVTFKKTSYDAGKALNSMIVFSQVPAYFNKYKIDSVEKVNPAGEKYFVLRVEAIAKTTAEEQAFALKWASKVAAKSPEARVGTTDGEESAPF